MWKRPSGDNAWRTSDTGDDSPSRTLGALGTGMTSEMPGSPVDNTPLVSVVIPVYEQPDLLREALRSVSNQTMTDYEVIVVDDASNTDLQPVIDECDIDVRLLVHEENKGGATARNTGIEVASGQYVAFLDADDTWREAKLEKQVAVFEAEDTDVGLVYTGFVQYETDGREWRQYPEASGDIYVAELERDRIHPTSTVMVRKSVFEEADTFDSSLPSRQDYDLWIRISEHYEVGYVDEILVDKREQPESISKDFMSRVSGDLAVFEKVRRRAEELDFVTRSRIHSYHHHVIGRDYDSKGDRWLAVKHLILAVLMYPFRPVSYAMLLVAVFDIDRDGVLVSFGRQILG